MNPTLGWGIALIVIGLLVTFSNVFGFLAGMPLLWLGIILVVVGVVLAGVHYFQRQPGGRRMMGRRPV